MAEAGRVEGEAAVGLDEPVAGAPRDPNRSGRPGGFCRAGGLAGRARGEDGANAMVLGVLVGALGSKIGGTRRMLYLSPAIGLAAGLGAFTAYDWWWVGLLSGDGASRELGSGSDGCIRC